MKIIKVGMITPWGTADHVKNIGGECYAVATPGHGGIFVPDEQLYKIPDNEQRLAMSWSGSPNWYEEDCCAASVLKHIPETRKGRTEEQVERWWAGSVKPQLHENKEAEKTKRTQEPWKLVVIHDEGKTLRLITGKGQTQIATLVNGNESDGMLMARAPVMRQALVDLIEAATPHIMKLGVRKGYHEMVALVQAQKASADINNE